MEDYIIVSIVVVLLLISQYLRFREINQEKRRIKILENTLDVLLAMRNSEVEKGNEMLKLIASLKVEGEKCHEE